MKRHDQDSLQQPRSLLGGLSPTQFMRRHWQRRPLLVRQAVPGVQPPVSRGALFDLAARDDVESRCVERKDSAWRLRQGPFARRSLPPLGRPGWTLLVQGLDLHSDAAHDMLRAFDFIPQMRLDDLMLSYASDQGGVGPHVDAYDVFLLQVAGRRRWRIAPPASVPWVPDLPLRILSRFEPTQEWLLEPGDMLYLPPHWAHDGVAEGADCMTASIGFRAPSQGELACALVARMADELAEAWEDEPAPADSGRQARGWHHRHADPGLAATRESGRIPEGLQAFADRVVAQVMRDSGAVQRALGAWLTEPKPQVWFSPQAGAAPGLAGVRLDRRTRMAYDDHHLYINGEAFTVAGRDARLLRELSDRRTLSARQCAQLSPQAAQALQAWTEAGWLASAA